MAFALIRGSNGWSINGTPDGMADAIKAMKNDHATISVIAFNKTDNNYAVVNTQGGAKWRGPDNFSAKMREIDCGEIKQISFGPRNTWAIVMRNGFCYYHAFKYPDGPASAIDDHQRDISYVALSPNKEEWIVGFANNGWNSMGCSGGMIELMKGVGNNKIHWAIMGRDASNWCVHHSGGWKWTMPGDFGNNFKESSTNGDVVPAIWG
jgi:hypothetical protein